MVIKYEQAPELKQQAEEIIKILNWHHIDIDNIAFLRSHGSKSRGTIARCHALGKAMQLGMGRTKSFYLIEMISKRFDNLSDEEKTKVIIHELMHIPFSFGGGFKHHNVVTEKNVDLVYDKFVGLKERGFTDSKTL